MMRKYRQVSKESIQDFVNESVVSLGRARAKKELQAFELAIRPFVHFWDEGIDALMRIELSADDPDAPTFAHLVKEFTTAGKNLSLFLRGRRIKMLKGTK
jgi:hypothetical protein